MRIFGIVPTVSDNIKIEYLIEVLWTVKRKVACVFGAFIFQLIHIYDAAPAACCFSPFCQLVFHAHLYIGHLWHARIAVVVATNGVGYSPTNLQFPLAIHKFGNRVLVLAASGSYVLAVRVLTQYFQLQ